VPDRRAGFDQGPDRRSGRRRSHRLVHECLAASSRPTRARLPPSAPPPRARRAGRSWSWACCSRRSPGAKRSPPSRSASCRSTSTATAIRTCSPPIAGNRAGAATSGAGRYARSRSRRPGGVVVDVASRPPAVAVLGATRPRQQQVIVSPDLLTGQARARMKGSYPGCRATKGVVGEGSGR